MYASPDDARFKPRGDVMVAELAKVQQKGPRSCDSEQSSRG
jgi:hypothetical protein